MRKVLACKAPTFARDVGVEKQSKYARKSIIDIP